MATKNERCRIALAIGLSLFMVLGFWPKLRRMPASTPAASAWNSRSTPRRVPRKSLLVVAASSSKSAFHR